MLRRIKQFFADDCGATAIEYGLIVGLIFLAIIAAMVNLRTNLENTYLTIGNAVTSN